MTATRLSEQARRTTPSTPPGASNAARWFGHDLFISFALGPAPRGTRDYASDLARKLRERDLAVFYSEESLPPGQPLSLSLTKGLHSAQALVLVLNVGTLAEPRWLRTEVESFRLKHPRRPLLAVSLDGALTDAVLVRPEHSWLGLQDQVWMDDVGGAEASDAVVGGIVRALLHRRRNLLWRWAQGALTTTLAALSLGLAVATWNASQNATAATKAANVATVATGQRLAAGIPAALAGDKDGGTRGNGDRAGLLMALVAVQLAPNRETWDRLAELRQMHLRTLWVKSEAVVTTAFSPDGRWLVQGTILEGGPAFTGRAAQSRYWLRDAQTGQLRAGPFMHDRHLPASAVRDDGRLAALGDDQGRLLLIDTNEGRLQQPPMDTGVGHLHKIAFLPGDNGLWVAGQSHAQRLNGTGQRVGSPVPLRGPTRSPDGGKYELATCGESAWVFRALPSGQIERRMLDGAATAKPELLGNAGLQQATSLAVDCRGQRVLAISGGRLHAWQRMAQGWVSAWQWPDIKQLPKDAAVHLSSDGQRGLLVVSNMLQTLDAGDGKPVGELQKLNINIALASLSPNGQSVVLTTYGDLRKEIDNRALDLRNPIQQLCADTLRHDGAVADITIATSPQAVAYIAGVDGQLSSCRLDTGQPAVAPIRVASAAIQRLGLSTEGNALLAASADGRITRWALPSLQALPDAPRGDWKDDSAATAFSVGATYVLRERPEDNAGWGVWRLNDGQRIYSPGGSDPYLMEVTGPSPVSFSPDGRWLLFGATLLSLDELPGMLWPLKGTQSPVKLDRSTTVFAPTAFSANGERFATVGEKAPLVYDSSSPHRPRSVELDLRELRTDGPAAMAFAPHSDDWIAWIHGRTVQYWQVDTGASAAESVAGDSQEDGFEVMVFTPDGKRLMIGTAKGRLLSLTPPWEWAAEVCRKLDKDLSPEEWCTWISPSLPYQAPCASYRQPHVR